MRKPGIRAILAGAAVASTTLVAAPAHAHGTCTPFLADVIVSPGSYVAAYGGFNCTDGHDMSTYRGTVCLHYSAVVVPVNTDGSIGISVDTPLYRTNCTPAQVWTTPYGQSQVVYDFCPYDTGYYRASLSAAKAGAADAHPTLRAARLSTEWTFVTGCVS